MGLIVGIVLGILLGICIYGIIDVFIQIKNMD